MTESRKTDSVDQIQGSKHIQAVLRGGWGQTKPSEECRARCALPKSLAENPHLDDLDRLGILRTIIFMELVARFGIPEMSAEAELDYYYRLSTLHALAATGEIPRPEDAGENEIDEAIETWVQRLEDWRANRRHEQTLLVEAAVRTGTLDAEFESTPSRFAVLLAEAAELQERGLVDLERDLAAMKQGLVKHDPEIEVEIGLEHMPELFELIRRTPGEEERRVCFGAEGGVHLGAKEFARGLDAHLGPDPGEPRERERATLDRMVAAKVSNETLDLLDALAARERAAALREVVARLRSEATPGTAMEAVLVWENFERLDDQGGIAGLARQIGRDESTVREAYSKVRAELKRRLTG